MNDPTKYLLELLIELLNSPSGISQLSVPASIDLASNWSPFVIE